jgi:hypothetical protein
LGYISVHACNEGKAVDCAGHEGSGCRIVKIAGGKRLVGIIPEHEVGIQIFIHPAVDLRNPIDQIGLLTCHRTVVLGVPDGPEHAKHSSCGPPIAG